MYEEELLKLIGKKESQTLEFKESLSLKEEIGETVSAFSNSNSGIILVGVNDSGGILGAEIGKTTVEALANYIKQNTDNQVYPGITVETLDRKRVLLVEVKEASEKPVFFRGKAYKRIGRSNHRLSASEIRKLAKEPGMRVYWDEQVCEGAGLKDIDEEKLKWFLRKAKAERNFDVNPETPVKEALERLKLTKDGKLANAAVLLFGKNPQNFFLQARIRCARFKGTTAVDFIDMKLIGGNIIDQVDGAERFVLSHIKKAAKVVMFKREEAWEYPPDALREAIVNAVCHRDYETTGNIRVAVFDDRVEITDPGKLPEPLTPEMLKQNHESVPRNKLIANAFFLMRNIEQWGRGTNKIVQWCVEHGLKEPDFEEIGGGFLVTFHAPEDMLSLIPEKGKVDLKELGLNERQIEALRLLVNEGKKLTIKEYSEQFGINERTARRDLQRLVASNLVKKVGETKGAYFQAG